MLDKKGKKTPNKHFQLFNTYKKLPYGFINENVYKCQKYSFKKQPVLLNIGKEKNKKNSQTKITKNLFYNKNIYIYSEENEKSKNLISYYKKYFSYNKSRKIISTKSENNRINKSQKTSSNSSKTNIFNFGRNNKKRKKKILLQGI